MGAGQHRLPGQFVRHAAQPFDQIIQCRQHESLASVVQHLRMREVVDVFRRAGEMKKLHHGRQLRFCREAFLEKVFHGLDVVIRRVLDGLDALRGGQVEALINVVQQGFGIRRKRGHFRDIRLCGQCAQPRDLDPEPVVHEAVFGEYLAQVPCFIGITTINRGQSGQRCELHAAAHGVKGGAYSNGAMTILGAAKLFAFGSGWQTR